MGKAFGVAPPLLSTLVVNVDKDWEGRRIENIGDPVSRNDAAKVDTVERLKPIYSCDYGLNWADLGVVVGARVYSSAYLGNGIAILGDINDHIFRSADYGATWTDLGGICGTMMECLISLGNGIALIGDDNGHVYRSTDYGATWVDLGVITGFASIEAFAYLGNGIVILGDGLMHVYRSADYGATWADLGAVTDTCIYSMAYLGNGTVVLGTAWGHVWRSTDYGLTWADLGAVGVAGNDIYEFAYLGNGIVILGNIIGHVWRSIDYGLTWADLGAIGDCIYASAYLGNGIAIIGDWNHHVYRSTDYGLTWVDLGAIALDQIRSMAYLGNGIVIMGEDNNHIYRSTSAFQVGNFNPNQFDKIFQFGCLGAITANGTSYLAPGNGATQLNEIRVRVSRPGILRNLYVWQRVASGAAGRTDIYTARVNGANTAITCTLDNAVEGADIVNEVLVAAGDQVSISLVSNNVADTSADVAAVIELM